MDPWEYAYVRLKTAGTYFRITRVWRGKRKMTLSSVSLGILLHFPFLQSAYGLFKNDPALDAGQMFPKLLRLYFSVMEN
jgi:hypothetical protein